MFGLYRTLLALLVVWQHLLDDGSLPVGKYAVHGFFVLSGFLMTYVMHETYGFSRRGKLSFAGNRALRLYPSWFAVAALATLILLFFPGPVFRPSMGIPQTFAEWLQNLTMVFWGPMPNMVSPRLSPATWALTIELFYYLAICLGVSRSKRLTWIWFALGVGYHAAINLLGAASGYAYFHILSGSLPFSIGALIYHYPLKLPKTSGWQVACFGTLVVIGLAVANRYFSTFYINMAVNAAIVAILFHSTGNRMTDRFVGDFSYHIYIMHWPIALVVYTLMGFAGPNPALAPFILTILACLAISLVLTRIVDRPVERWRRRLRHSNSAEPELPAHPVSK